MYASGSFDRNDIDILLIETDLIFQSSLAIWSRNRIKF